MLNRKLTVADFGKDFIACDSAGTEFAVSLLYMDAHDFVMYTPGDSDKPETYFSVNADGFCTEESDPDNYRLGYKILKEVEVEKEPEEFRLTGKEVWKAADPEHEKQLDEALGLTEIKLKIPTAVFGALEAEAKQKGIITKALIREILVKHAAALISLQDN
jgi:hypothetical protein